MVGPDTSAGANHTSVIFGSGWEEEVFCSGCRKSPDFANVRIDETQLELLPERLRSRAHGTVYLVIQSREGAPRPSLILINVLAASSHLTGQSRAGTSSRNSSRAELQPSAKTSSSP